MREALGFSDKAVYGWYGLGPRALVNEECHRSQVCQVQDAKITLAFADSYLRVREFVFMFILTYHFACDSQAPYAGLRNHPPFSSH